MKKIVLICGLITGAILCANMVVMVNLMYANTDFKGIDIIGYAAHVVMFSLVFFGIRNYRNEHLNGYIPFGKALKVGALIALVASTLYVTAWLFYYYLFVPDFIDVYTSYALRHCAAEDIPAKTAELADFKEMYKNPLFVILMTYAEALPIGLVVALVSALILKKKEPAKELKTS
jgi:hypothetical protein